jgi:hypothetical protein
MWWMPGLNRRSQARLVGASRDCVCGGGAHDETDWRADEECEFGSKLKFQRLRAETCTQGTKVSGPPVVWRGSEMWRLWHLWVSAAADIMIDITIVHVHSLWMSQSKDG